MSALREIVAKYYVEVDSKPLTQLDKQIAHVNKRLLQIGSAIAVGFSAAAYASYNFVQMASGVEETMNVINVTFGEKGARDVVAWSKVTGDAMSRSQYDLQQYASTFGAFLSPQLAGTGVDIQAMSQKLSELSVDLASFFNLASDEEAMMKLRSGLSGETEAVRSLGIDLSDTGLSAFNKETKMVGGGKKTQSLTMPEKTLLRYAKILKDTANAQGDAERTQASWANQLKSFKALLHETGVEIGQALIEPAKEVLKWLKATIKFIRSLKDNLVVLSVIAGGFAARLVAINVQLGIMALATPGVVARLWEMVRAFTAIAAPAALFIGFALAIEDLYHFLQGNESTFHYFAKDVLGLEQPFKTVNRLLRQMELYIERSFNKLYKLWSLLKAGASYMVGGGSAGLNDALAASRNIDTILDIKQKQIDQEAGDPDLYFRQAVAASDPAKALTEALNKDLAKADVAARQAYKLRFLDERKKYLDQHPEQRTEWDLRAGTAFQPLTGKADLSKQRIVPHTVKEGDMNVTLNLTVDKDATPKQIEATKKAAEEGLIRARESLAATKRSVSTVTSRKGQ